MDRRAGGFDGEGGLKLEGPERQIVPVAAGVRHRAAPKIPPAIPLRPGEIDVVVGAIRRGPEPEVPVEAARNGVRFRRAVLDTDDVAVFRGIGFTLEAP